MNKKLLTLFCLTLLMVLTAVAYYYYPKREKISPTSLTNYAKEQLATAEIGTTKIRLEIADSETERAQGLSNRNAFTDNRGMLFDFTNTEIKQPTFWMKGMKFSLDILWIKNNKIIGITRSTEVPNPKLSDYQLDTYTPPAEIDYALEVNAGYADNHNISVGDNFRLIK